MGPIKLTRVVVKPTLACTADCHFCSSRRSLHKQLIRNKTISLDQWKEVLTNAKALGAEYFVISGGEPTLYRQLIDLVKIGKETGLVVTINSNGFLMREKLIKQLLAAGLDSVCISLHSHVAEVFDAMKQQKGLWMRTTEAIRIFYDLTRKNPRFSLQTQAIISRENYQTFPELMALHYELGAKIMRVAYLEGDYQKKYLLNEKEIIEFREKVIPRAISFCQKLDPSLRQTAENNLRGLYREDQASLQDYAQGIYQPGIKSMQPCYIPEYQAGPILANGDVHPCNIVEYTHHPVVGNLFQKNLPEIWHGEVWNQFRKNHFDCCKFCPMPLHTHLVFRKDLLTLRKVLKRPLVAARNFFYALKHDPFIHSENT